MSQGETGPSGAQAEDAPEARLHAWRRERALVAEAGRKERLEQRQAEAELASQAATEALRAEAAGLFPGQGDGAVARERLQARIRAERRGFLLRLVLFVILPALAAACYMAFVMTPLYEARTVVAIVRAGVPAENTGGAALPFAGTAPTDDAFKAQEYLNSPALMDALEREMGLVTSLSGKAMDPLGRLRDAPLLGIAGQDLFHRFVRSSINIQTGLITLRVRAPSRDLALEVSRRTVALAGAQVAGLADARDRDRLGGARANVAEAEARLKRARAEVTRLQIRHAEADPRARLESALAALRGMDDEVRNIQAMIEQAEAAGTGQSPQADRLRARAALLARRIDLERRRMVQGTGGEAPLNARVEQFELAMIDLQIAEEMLGLAVRNADELERTAALERPYLQVVIPAVASATPTAPNVLRGTFLVLLLLMSLLGLVRTGGFAR